MPLHHHPTSASHSSRPPSVLNLRCREDMLVESPTHGNSSGGRSQNTTPAATVAAAALLSVNCAASNNTAAGGDDGANAAEVVVVAPPRYYLPFGQNSNELSMERKRLHRISLQAQQQQWNGGMGGRRHHQSVLLEDDDAYGDGVLQQQQQRTNLTVEVPKGGGNILTSIDTNIPTNGSRLLNTAVQSMAAQQRTHDTTPISSSGNHRLVLRPVAVNANSSSNTTLVVNRKRRAAEEDEADERRLNAKERLWVCADVDRAVHLDGRTLQALLQAEKSVTVSEAQIRHEQRANHAGGDEPGIEEWARTRAVEWMQEVCEADHADFVVLPLAVAYLDRMLACRFVPRRNLQALASACLLLASKLRAPHPMNAHRMAEHTDNSVRMEELLDWEMLVLNHLQWNLLQSTPFEFFDQLLVRWPVLEALREDFALTLHRTQKALRLATQLPSVQAAATLLFVAVRTRKKHLLAESEQAIRRHLGIDPVNTLAPLFGHISTTLDGASATTGGVEAQRQYAQNVLDEQQQQHLLFGQPPSSKLMSLGEDRRKSASSTTKSSSSFHQPSIPSLWEQAATAANACTKAAPPNAAIAEERHHDALPPTTAPAAQSPVHHQQQQLLLLEDDASRSSSNSSNSAESGAVFSGTSSSSLSLLSSAGGVDKQHQHQLQQPHSRRSAATLLTLLVNDSGFFHSADTSHCGEDEQLLLLPQQKPCSVPNIASPSSTAVAECLSSTVTTTATTTMPSSSLCTDANAAAVVDELVPVPTSSCVDILLGRRSGLVELGRKDFGPLW